MRKAKKPRAKPIPIPPRTSNINKFPIAEKLASFLPVAMPRIAIKTTTPTPSLNRDSPVILVSNDFGAPAFFNIPNTATGSVGEISAPNRRQ